VDDELDAFCGDADFKLAPLWRERGELPPSASLTAVGLHLAAMGIRVPHIES